MKIPKKVYVKILSTFTAFCFIGLVGSIGAYEVGNINARQTIIQCIMFIIVGAVYAILANYLDQRS